jgi:hypothetical protein
VRDALFATVEQVHVPWGLFPEATHELLAVTMDGHDAVFTTSYDLSLYGNHLFCVDVVDIKDFFWNQLVFCPPDTRVHSRSTTRVFYLHGGVHLWQDDKTGEDGKWSAGSARLLDIQSRYGPTVNKRPLFVSEGTSRSADPRSSFRLDYAPHRRPEPDHRQVLTPEVTKLLIRSRRLRGSLPK